MEIKSIKGGENNSKIRVIYMLEFKIWNLEGMLIGHAFLKSTNFFPISCCPRKKEDVCL